MKMTLFSAPSSFSSENLVGCDTMEDCIGVVLDAGSQTTKAGFIGEAFPRAVVPTATSRFHKPGLIDGFPITINCGKEAIRNRGISKLIWPVENGFITDWDEMEILWHHVFYRELHVPPEEAQVMHAVHPLVSRRDMEKMSEILFESFTVKSLYLMKSPVLVLHASGRTTGVVWEAGSSCSYVAPVFEGFPLKHATILSPLTGELLTDRLQGLLAETGYSFTTPVERDLLNVIKAKHCYVPIDYYAELNSVACSGENKISHQLPDGQKILLGEERFQCPEVLFKPSIANLEYPSIVKILNSSIMKCDSDHRSTFFENIVVAGGTSMYPGLVDRLRAELLQNALKSNVPMKPMVDAMPSRQYAAWIGGSILGSLNIFKGFWLTREEYDDGGSDRVKYKFF